MPRLRKNRKRSANRRRIGKANFPKHGMDWQMLSTRLVTLSYSKITLTHGGAQTLSRHPSVRSAILGLITASALLCPEWSALRSQFGPKGAVGIIPGQLELPLPESASFLNQVATAGDRYASLRQDYVCRTRLRIEPSELSASRAPVTEDYDSFYLGGRELHRLIAVDGHPLSDAAKAEEESRLQEETQKVTVNGTYAPAATLEGTVLATSIFTDEKRLVSDRRNLISFHFEGDRRREPRTILEMIAKSLSGNVLIDEQDHAIVKMNGTTRYDVIYGRQLLVPRSFKALVYEAKRVNDETYVPTLVTIAAANRQRVGVTANVNWKRSLELRTYTVTSCEKFRVTSRILP